GDTIQTLKAGLLEAADIFLVNKSEREGAHRIQGELQSMIEMGSAAEKTEGWQVPVLQVQAHKGVGMEELVQTLNDHHQKVLGSSGHRKKQERIRTEEFYEVLEEILKGRLLEVLDQNPLAKNLLEKVKKGDQNPFEAALDLKNNINISIK